MLSSANQSVPTVKQFVQPYFIQIAPGGAIRGVCEPFEELINDFSIGDYLEINIVDVFSRLGILHTAPNTGFFDPKFFPFPLPLSSTWFCLRRMTPTLLSRSGGSVRPMGTAAEAIN